MNSVGDAFGWAFRDPAWVGKVVVQGLILIIPIVGAIAAVGWLMMAFENARNGRNELPPAGFHLGRGIGLVGVLLVYHKGVGGGFDIGNIWKYATSNVTNSVVGGLVIFVSGLIGALGLIACCIGVFFTIIYSISIQAGVAAWFERQQSAPAAPPVPPPATPPGTPAA